MTWANSSSTAIGVFFNEELELQEIWSIPHSVVSEAKYVARTNSRFVLTALQPSSNPLCSNFSVAAFSETVRTFASSNPSGVVASISIVTFRVTPGVAPSGPRTSSASFLKSDA